MIHPTAIIDTRAELAGDVTVGPYTIIGPDVTIDSGCVIGPHVVLKGPTRLGQRNRIFQFASIGEACQDKKYKGEPTALVLGDDNEVREYVTLQRGTIQDRGETTIGDRNFFMAYVHVGHDCVVGNDIIFANNTTLAGHVHVGNGVILGGFTAIHQRCRLGHYCMTAMCSAVNHDVPAFVMVQGNLAHARGMNIEGMRRRGYAPSLIACLRNAYKTIYRKGLTLDAAIAELESNENRPQELQWLIESLKMSQRGIVR